MSGDMGDTWKLKDRLHHGVGVTQLRHTDGKQASDWPVCRASQPMMDTGPQRSRSHMGSGGKGVTGAGPGNQGLFLQAFTL